MLNTITKSNPRQLCAFIFTLFISSACLRGIEPLLRWRWSNPSPHGNNVVDLIHTNGIYFQVGDRGQIHTSTDKQTWTHRESGTRKALRSLCFFRDRTFTSGEEGVIVSADFNLKFALTQLNTADWLEGLACSSDTIVAVGDNAAIYSSSDGTNWQRQAVAFSDWLRSVAFGLPGNKPVFVAVGEQGFVATSSNGVLWQRESAFTTADLNRVAWLRGQFWVVGDQGTVYTSSDGRRWTKVITGATGPLNAIAASADSMIVAGDMELRQHQGVAGWSDELSTFNLSPAPGTTYLSALHDGATFVVGGRAGLLVEGVKQNSASETSWLQLDSSPRSWLWGLKSFPAAFIAVGDKRTILTSANGIAWTAETVPAGANDDVLLGIGGRTNLAISVGTSGTILLSRGELLPVVSTNLDGTISTNLVDSLGLVWEQVSPPQPPQDLQGVATFGDLLVLSGSTGTILTSNDGQTWKKQITPTTSFLSGVDASPAGMVAVGRDGTILTSANAVLWQKRVSNTTNWIYRVRSLNGKWIAVGEGGILLTSTDTVFWKAQSSGTKAWLNDVCWDGSTFFAVGTQGTVLKSSDTITWENACAITGKSLTGAATDGTRLVTVGVEGVILRSRIRQPSLPIVFVRHPTNSTQTMFLFGGETDQRFRLDRSVDLQNWSIGPELDILDPSGTLIYEDSTQNAPERQFFRGVTIH